jgi:Flp pilus assembly protein CpaB
MSKAHFILIVVIAAVVVGGAVFLATWDIPAPTQRVEKVLPNDRFPR